MKLTNDNDPVSHFKTSCGRAAAAFLEMGNCLSRVSMIPMDANMRAYVNSAIALLDAQWNAEVVTDALRDLRALEASVEKVANNG